MQSKKIKAIDLEIFLKKHPLNFLLFYGDYEVINTVYLDDGSPLVDLSLELFNQTTQQIIKFAEPPKDVPASADNCHFSLNLEGIFVLENPPEGWEVKEEESIFYFLKKQAGELQPKAANGSANKIVLTLKKFRAVPEGGTRTIRAELTYGPLLQDKDNKPFQDEYGQYSSYGNTIFITNNRGGKKTLPLQVGFAAGNTVLNDGTATNSLELLIANKNWPSSNLSLSQDSEFVIRFEMGNQEGAVATETQIKAIAINSPSSNWPVQHVANSTEWTVKPNSGITQLASNEAIKLNITNLVTSNSSGAGYLYVRYKNIPNYPDGQFVVPVEKSPLLYRLAQVGIGTTHPSAKLQVSGGDAIVSGKVGIGTTSPLEKLHVEGNIRLTGNINGANQKLSIYSNTNAGNSNAWIELWGTTNGDSTRTGELSLTGKYIDFRYNSTQSTDGTVGMRLNNEGRLGIGTTTPSAKLHVEGGDAIVSGKVGIGTTSPLEKLHVEGNIRLTGNINGANQKLSIYSNTNAGNSNAWIELWGTTNGDSTRTGELSLTGKYIDFRYNSTQSTDGTVGMRLRSDGNVGIGTTSPSAKLDVNGSVKLGDGSTAWNRIICGKVIVNYDNLSQSKVFGKGISCAMLIPKNPGETLFSGERGIFKITFEKPVDPEKLVVIVTPQDRHTDNIVNIAAVESDGSGFIIHIKDSKERTSEASSFHFIAVELTENINKLVTSLY